ncbi:hypothetical protein [Paramuribaculum intestinale]|uniref:hypothetical protein n=1 Tax=Paramuribaculum intestinale TaxID=2094151 RepID=UPI0025B0C92C|nr:hypothetical protein [Paramuribaculum intestinale]
MLRSSAEWCGRLFRPRSTRRAISRSADACREIAPVVDPGQERTTHSAASPGGHEPATWRQHREEEEEERERSKAIGKNHRSHQIAPMTPTIL